VAGTACGYGVKKPHIRKNYGFIDFFKEHIEKPARVHFIPNLKVGVFVTLRAP
jgi:hypothetical protein